MKQSTKPLKIPFRRATLPRVERDPRLDPQAGDSVRGNGQVRCVRARAGPVVRCTTGQYDFRMNLVNWQTWCRLNNATAGPLPHTTK